MAKQCFVKSGSNPPICAIHNVRLTRRQFPAELIASGYKPLAFFECPVSGQVIDDSPTQPLIA